MTIPAPIIQEELRAYEAWSAALQPLIRGAFQEQDGSRLAAAETAACDAWMKAKKATDDALAAAGLPLIALGGRILALKAMIQKEARP